nr:nucleoside kinase [Deinococcus arboris]
MSGTGKTSVAEELQRRGYHVLHGDRTLTYRGDPDTGAPVPEPLHASERDRVVWQYEHHLWDIAEVKAVMADHSRAITFFCGGLRNVQALRGLFDNVFVLEVSDLATLYRRLDERVARDPTDWDGQPEEKALVERLHLAQEGVPRDAIAVEATQPLIRVVDEILRHIGALPQCPEG